jgi:hypothetical protein
MIRYQLRRLLFWRYGFNHYNYVFWQVKTRLWNLNNSPSHAGPAAPQSRLRYYDWETGLMNAGSPTPMMQSVSLRVDRRVTSVWGRILWGHMRGRP